MGFWSGFEGLTGHRPGAFKGFSLKDIIDDDLWKRKQRTWSGQMEPTGPGDLRFGRGGEPMMTNWYKGRGAGGVADQPRQPAFSSPMRPEGALAGPRPIQESQRVDSDRPSYAEQHAAIMRNRYPGGQTTVSAARPWPNIQAQMLSDPLQGVGSMRIPPAELMGTQVPQAQPNRGQFQMSDMTIPPAELMGEKTTVKKIFADPTKSDTVTETIKEKVPMGDMRIPTSELMGTRSLAPRRQPTSIMDMMIPIGELMEMRRRRDEMRFRQNPYHMLRRG